MHKEQEAGRVMAARAGAETGAIQVLSVAVTGRTEACVSLFEKSPDGEWVKIFSAEGRIGRDGLGKTREGDWKTPAGVFRFTCAFGTREDPGSLIPYQRVAPEDYWSGDQREGHAYNRMVSIRDIPDLDTGSSEHLIDYDPFYRYCLALSYNEEGIPGRGSAIFLHCLGKEKGFTAGCVAVPEACMVKILRSVNPDCAVVIGPKEDAETETGEG
ncbi:MAG: L,D-transpeptidase family protein [Clostridia bacterium]|nr:L,D-transpeptidase family protein [Clostridia bacterium]